MGKKHHPKKGSQAYSPRKRANEQTARFNSWPETDEKPKIQGFAGYKAGMTHVFLVDTRKRSTTSKREVQHAATVIEVPPMRVASIRFYKQETYGLKTANEVRASEFDRDLARRLPVPKGAKPSEKLKTLKATDYDDIRILAHTLPAKVASIPKKMPELMELRVGGGSMDERLAYARGLLGKELKITDFAAEGAIIDVAAITKGKGFQGHIKRWGVKLQPRKNSKHRRMIGTLGPHFPSYVLPTVPQSGQMGYHQRTEYNKRILKIGENGEEITPKGGFLHYGNVNNSYVVIQGSVPGPSKRLIRFRDPIRYNGPEPDAVQMTYVSTSSKQGV